jgi:spore coat protein U-like protein
MRALTALLLAGLALPLQAQPTIDCAAGTTAGVLAFGPVNPISPLAVSTMLGEFVVRCTNSANASRNVRLRLAISAGNSGTAAQRQMRRAGSSVPLFYNLYEDAAYTLVWTASTGGRPDEVLEVPARGAAEIRRPIFGRIPGGQRTVSVGAYSDSLTVNVRY